MIVRSDRVYHFDFAPETVWSAIARVDEYQQWWPWLRRFDATDLRNGEQWDCVVRPPLPYALRFCVTLGTVVRPSRIDAAVTGDIRGDASVALVPTSEGCRVQLVSALEPAGQPLRSVTRLAPWVARFGHDWVLDSGLRQFHRRALGPR